MKEEPRYYESDSPCRKCNGTTRYRSPVHLKGKCACCVVDRERDAWAEGWVKTTENNRKAGQ